VYTRFHPTPLCDPTIGAILNAGFGPAVFLMYPGGAGEALAVGLLAKLAPTLLRDLRL
jgi:hypothetical protein